MKAPHRTSTLLACALALLVVTAVAAQSQRPAFRAAVDLVSMNVTVTDSSRHYVSDLVRDDFTIVENGVPQTLTFFAKQGIPLALAVLIDSSASMEQSLPVAQEAAIGFTRQLDPKDIGMIVDFDSRVQIRQGFSSDHGALEQAIRQTAAGGSTALFNAIYIALKELNKLIPEDNPEAPRRRAIVVLSDGEDTSSLVNFDEVLDLASRSDTVIYAIGLGAHELPIARAGHTDGQFVLRRLAQQTGGRAFFPTDVKELAGVYSEIRNEISNQYSLAYESAATKRDGQWRGIAVRVNRAGATVRTRQGYFAPKTASLPRPNPNADH